jgi:post-segregation antitoxin (ccd killing protein)
MSKRKITVTVDEEIVAQAQQLGAENLSAVVNNALALHVERLASRAALRQLLDSWNDEFGALPDAEIAAAGAAFDELNGLGLGAYSAGVTPLQSAA